jgi:hypothetical protein
MIGAMLNQKGATGKTKPALATDLTREGLCVRIKLAASGCGLTVIQRLRVLSSSCPPNPGDNIGPPQ